MPKVKAKQPKRTNPIDHQRHKQRNQTRKQVLEVDSDVQQKNNLQCKVVNKRIETVSNITRGYIIPCTRCVSGKNPSGTPNVKSLERHAGMLMLFHVGFFHTVAPLCNSLRNDVASMETYSSWMNCPKEKCVSADLMHLFLVRFVTVRLTYIFIDHPDCEYIIILNTSIVIYDFWRLSVLRSSTPSMTIFGNRHRQKACLLTNTRMIHTHLFTINMILM